MSPFTAIKGIFRGLACLFVLPFLVIGFAFQAVLLIFSWLASTATVLLAFGMIAASISFLLAGPFWFLASRHHTHSNGSEEGRRVRSVETREWSSGPARVAIAVDRDSSNPRTMVSSSGQLVEIVRQGDRRHVKLRLGQGRAFASATDDAEVDSQDAFDQDVRESDSGDWTSDRPIAGVLVDAPGPSGEPMSGGTDAEAESPEESEWVNGTRPEWVDAIFEAEGPTEFVRAECGPCDSAQACDLDFDVAVQTAVRDYVRDRTRSRMQQLGCTFLPWHEDFVRRVANQLSLEPTKVYRDQHDTSFGDMEARTYFKYGLLEFGPAAQGQIDQDVTQWARSFQVGSLWSVALAGLASVYLVVRMLRSKKAGPSTGWRKRLAAGTVAGLAAILIGLASYSIVG